MEQICEAGMLTEDLRGYASSSEEVAMGAVCKETEKLTARFSRLKMWGVYHFPGFVRATLRDKGREYKSTKIRPLFAENEKGIHITKISPRTLSEKAYRSVRRPYLALWAKWDVSSAGVHVIYLTDRSAVSV